MRLARLAIHITTFACIAARAQPATALQLAIPGIARFTIDGAVYNIPRDYLARTSSYETPYLEIIYPSFEPAGTSKEACVDWFAAQTKNGCVKFSFSIYSGRGPSRSEMAATMAHAIPQSLKVSSVDEYGFHTWRSRNNPNSAYFERGSGARFLSFFCAMGRDASQKVDGVCTDMVFLPGGGSAKFLFPYRLRNKLPGIEAGIDALTLQFRQK